jgi:glycosyltransferase involved in cell wall biosynthesis
MRIFMLVQHPGARGPVPKHTAHLVEALRSLGCTVVTHPWGQRRPDETLPAKMAQRTRDVLSVRRALRGEAFDIAVVKTAHDWLTLLRDIAVVPVIRCHCRPVVVQLQGSRAPLLIGRGSRAFKLITALLLAMVDGVLVLSTEEQRLFRAFRGRPPVLTVKNPYLRAFPSGSTEASDSSQKARVLFVGRMIQEKGIFELVDAFADVFEEMECELVMVGEGNDEPALRAKISNLGLDGHVQLLGYQSGSALVARYRESMVFVLPSWSEGFPTVIAEAMDAGLPIITTRIRGAADHLIDEKNALFVEPRDVQGLAAAMKRLLRDPILRAHMKSANHEGVRMFDPDLVAKEYLQALQSVSAEMGSNG